MGPDHPMTRSSDGPMYIELHSRSAFSFLEGSSVPEELVARCAALGMPAMALLDRDGVYGAPRFHMAAKKVGIKAHMGAEVNCNFSPQRYPSTRSARSGQAPSTALRTGSGTEKKETAPQQIIAPSDHPITRWPDPPILGEFRVPLLVSSRAGYQNLCRLITKMKLRAAKGEGAVYPEELQEYAEGLICLTGGY